MDEPRQIIKYNKTFKTFQYEKEVFDKVIDDNQVLANCNISIISIIGPSRKGKSFLLNFFLRYLYAEYQDNNSSNWLAENNIPLTGFSWKTGSKRQTDGIWIWSKIFTKTRSNGEKIGIILMDTQGTFDNNSRTKDNTIIFSMCTMFSSLQIYNLYLNIEEQNFQHLQLFIEYGNLILKDNPSAKIFQKLLFLVRDWSYEYEHSFGFIGGSELLEKKLELQDDQDDELTFIQDHLRACYEKLECFLMPSPGNIATHYQKFTGELKDIDEIFKKKLMELIPKVLAPENIVPTKINGVTLDGYELKNAFPLFWEIFNKECFPNSQKILEATAEVHYKSLSGIISTEFKREYTKMFVPHERNGMKPPFNEMIQHYLFINKIYQNKFRAKNTIGDENLREIYYKKFCSKLEIELFVLVLMNNYENTENNGIEASGRTLENIKSYQIQNEEERLLMIAFRKYLNENVAETCCIL